MVCGSLSLSPFFKLWLGFVLCLAAFDLGTRLRRNVCALRMVTSTQNVSPISLSFTRKQEVVFHNTFYTRDADNVSACVENSRHLFGNVEPYYLFITSWFTCCSVVKWHNSTAKEHDLVFHRGFSKSTPTFLVDRLWYRIYLLQNLHFACCVFEDDSTLDILNICAPFSPFSRTRKWNIHKENFMSNTFPPKPSLKISRPPLYLWL